MTDDPKEVLSAVGVECAEVKAAEDSAGELERMKTVLPGPPAIEREIVEQAIRDYDAAILALATGLAAVVSYFEGEKDIDSAAPWALGEIRRILAEPGVLNH